MLFALRALVNRVVDDLGAAGKRAGRLVLALECENGDLRELVDARRRTDRRAGDACSTCCAPGSKASCSTRRSIGLRLVAEALEDGGVPLTFFAGGDPDPDALGIVLARLDAALGDGRALRGRIVERPAHRTAHGTRCVHARAADRDGWTITPPHPYRKRRPCNSASSHRSRSPCA